MEDFRRRRDRYFPRKSLCGKYISVGERDVTERDGTGRRATRRGGEGRDKIERRDGLERDGKGWRGTGLDREGRNGVERVEGWDGVERDGTA